MRIWVLALPLFAWACGSERPDVLPPGNGGGDGIELSKLDAETVKATCAAIYRCGAHSRIGVAIKLAFVDEAGCREKLARANSDADIKLAVAAGTVRYDGKAARTCLAGYSASCLDFSRGPPTNNVACRSVFTGTVPTGGACNRYEECEGDAYCAATTTSSAACAGTCRPRVALGAACSGTEQCSWAQVTGRAECGSPGPSLPRVCRDITIGAPANAGGDCGMNDATGVETPCGPDLWCDETNNKCAARIAAGAPCAISSECLIPETLCRAPAGSQARVCGPITLQTQLGAVCDQESLLCSSAAGLECNLATQTCTMTPVGGAVDSVCVEELFSQPCNDGLYCQYNPEGPSVCTAKVANGQSCSDSDGCIAGFCVQGTCRARDCRTL